MAYLTIVINTILVFFISNAYLFNKSYAIKTPTILMIFLISLFIVINIFPSLFAKRLNDKNLYKIRNGYRLLIVFFANLLLCSGIYLFSIIKYNVDIKVLLINLLIIILVLNIVFWNGIIRVYLFSEQLGILF